jgi:hypothetical protein
MNTKTKPVDLGALQDAYIKAKATYQTDLKAYNRAEEALGRSRESFATSEAALKAACKSVFAQPTP